MANVTRISDPVEYDSFMKADGGTKVIRFWATWCRPCLALEPIYNDVANSMKDSASFAEVDIDVAPEIANNFGIRSVPTVLVFKNGQPIESVVGLNRKETYTQVIKSIA